MLGEYVADATPFEMYVEGAVVYLMFNRWPSYVCDSASVCKWVTETCIQALDVRDPAHVQLTAEQKLPGALVAARRAGNILYLATAEPPSCYGCQEQPNTAITSFELSGLTPLRQVSQLRVPFLANQLEQRVTVAEHRMYIARHGYDAQAQRISSSSV